MEKLVTITIKGCQRCPHAEWEWNGIDSICALTKKEISNPYAFSKDCPLPDAPSNAQQVIQPDSDQ
jgi:hypothetical protein